MILSYTGVKRKSRQGYSQKHAELDNKLSFRLLFVLLFNCVYLEGMKSLKMQSS